MPFTEALFYLCIETDLPHVLLIRTGYASYMPLHSFPRKDLTHSMFVWLFALLIFGFAPVFSNRSGTHGLHRKRAVRIIALR
jgi:hypothetical protein